MICTREGLQIIGLYLRESKYLIWVLGAFIKFKYKSLKNIHSIKRPIVRSDFISRYVLFFQCQTPMPKAKAENRISNEKPSAPNP